MSRNRKRIYYILSGPYMIKWIVLTVIGVADILLKMGGRFPVSKKSQLKKYLPHSNHCSRNGINWVLSNENRYKELCIKAREKAAACFDIKKVARQYAELYG